MTPTRRANEDNVTLFSGLAEMLLGVWIFVSPFVFDIQSPGQWHMFFWGPLVVILGGYQMVRRARVEGPLTGVSIGVLAIGAWIVLAPFVYGYAAFATYNNIVTGLLLALVGWIEVRAAQRVTTPSTA